MLVNDANVSGIVTSPKCGIREVLEVGLVERVGEAKGIIQHNDPTSRRKLPEEDSG